MAILTLTSRVSQATPFSLLQQGNMLQSRADVRQIIPAYSGNLMGYWRFESNFNDFSGNAKTAQARGTPSLTSGGHLGGSTSLNGTTDYYDFASNVMPAATNFTISLWFNQTANANVEFWGLGATSGCNPSSTYFGISADGRLHAGVGCGGQIDASAIASVGAWNHAVLTKDASSNMAIYLNGVLVAGPTNINGANALSTGNELLGAFWNGGTRRGFFNGKFDEVAIWNVALSAADIAALYQGCKAFKMTFIYTGANQTFTVPEGCTAVSIKAWGAGGGGSSWYDSATGGGGGYVRAGISTTAGESLTVIVGQKGSVSTAATFGGGGGGGGAAGGSCCGGSGGGRSEVARAGTPLIVAGGGGGAGSHNWGGNGGGSTGGNGDASFGPGAGAGIGGSQVGPGSGGVGAAGGTSGANGSASAGGTGGNSAAGNDSPGGGGGGGYGGGGGGGGGGPNVAGAGGGGGSNYVPTGGKSISASGRTPGNSGDADRNGAGGGGARSSAGADGIVVISFP